MGKEEGTELKKMKQETDEVWENDPKPSGNIDIIFGQSEIIKPEENGNKKVVPKRKERRPEDQSNRLFGILIQLLKEPRLDNRSSTKYISENEAEES